MTPVGIDASLRDDNGLWLTVGGSRLHWVPQPAADPPGCWPYVIRQLAPSDFECDALEATEVSARVC